MLAGANICSTAWSLGDKSLTVEQVMVHSLSGVAVNAKGGVNSRDVMEVQVEPDMSSPQLRREASVVSRQICVELEYLLHEGHTVGIDLHSHVIQKWS